MAQEAPPAKLTLPKAKVEAAAVNAHQWGIAAAATPASGGVIGVRPHSEQLVGYGYNLFFDPSAAPAKPAPAKAAAAPAPAKAAAASTGTQAPPPAKLELCKAKLEAAEVNEKQWLKPAAEATAPAASTGTQAPPPAKLELCKAKLEAAEVNEKQWLKPAAEATAPAASAAAPAAAPAAAAAAFDPRAAEAQEAMSHITMSYTDKLSALSNKVAGKMAPSSPAAAGAPGAGTTDLSKFRKESVEALKRDIAPGSAGSSGGSFAKISPKATGTVSASFTDKLQQLASRAAGKLTVGDTSGAPAGNTDLSQVRKEAVEALKSSLAK